MAPRRLHKYHSGEYPTYYYIGKKRFGKSTAAEWSAEKYKRAKYLIFDGFDAGDFEACYWAIRDCPKCHRPIRYDQRVCPRCKIMPRSDYKVLLVIPEDIEVEITDPNFELISVDEGLGNIVSRGLKTSKIISVACGLFDREDLYYTLAEWMHQWLQLNRDVFMKDTVFLLREAANVAFSRHRTYKNQSKLRKAVFELVRESGHYQTTILFDTQRFMDLDISVRGNIENIVVKRHNEHSMPKLVENLNDDIKDRRWRWYQAGISSEAINKVQPEVPYLRKNEFYVKFDDGSFAFGKNGMPSFHHKGPKDYFRFLTDTTYKQELFTFKKEEESIKRAPKIVRMKLATEMITDGMDEEEVARYLKTRPSTVKKWVEEYETKYAKEST
jgi:hypothetical protein